jgi:hypothetical protein
MLQMHRAHQAAKPPQSGGIGTSHRRPSAGAAVKRTGNRTDTLSVHGTDALPEPRVRRLRRTLAAAARGVRAAIRRRVPGRPLIVVHIQEIGLREQVRPVVRWLAESRKAAVWVVVADDALDAYRTMADIDFEGRHAPRLLSERQFRRTGRTPAVALSLHPETPSTLAAAFANGRTRRVVLPHALSDKGQLLMGADDRPVLRECDGGLRHCDVLLLTGPAMRDGSLRIYCERFPDTARRVRFLEIGSPKTDGLFRPEQSREEVLRDLGLEPNRPTVCYAPTWQRCASLQTHGEEIMRALAALPMNVIVKLHHISLKSAQVEEWVARSAGDRDWRRILAGFEAEHPNLRMARGQDATPFLAAADVLVSDASGAAYEFLLLDRPIVFFDVPELFAEYGTHGISHWGRTSGDVVTTVEEMAAAVTRAVADPDRQRGERRAMIRRVVFSRGDATERAGRALLALAEEAR